MSPLSLRSANNDYKCFSLCIQKENVTWYHKGPRALLDARLHIAQFSLPRTARRLADAREELKIPATMRQARLQELQKQSRVHIKHSLLMSSILIAILPILFLFNKRQSLAMECSQVGDTRPLSHCEFSPNARMLATSSW